jgi:hypothetical protein
VTVQEIIDETLSVILGKNYFNRWEELIPEFMQVFYTHRQFSA